MECVLVLYLGGIVDFINLSENVSYTALPYRISFFMTQNITV